MIYSMTGFGKAEGKVGSNSLSVQMRSLNSKLLDLNLRLPSAYRELEGEIRKMVNDSLYRGKVEISIGIQEDDSTKAPSLNKEVVKKYFSELEEISKELGIENSDPMKTITRLPEVFSSEEEALSEEEASSFLGIIKQAIDELNSFREQEGKETEKDLKNQIDQILSQLELCLQYEDERIETVRTRVQQKFDEFLDKDQINQDRFEQEMIFYLEKFDISEEKVRLRAHCQYFIEVLEQEKQQGKKLNFISQEIGREINTLGSKANHAGMQKQVVLMKESLEKIKEQVLNVL